MISIDSTLVQICDEHYFLLNSKIRHSHTKHQYKIAITNLRRLVGHEPTMADLTDDNIALMMRHLLDAGLAERTINGRREKIHALWTWLAKRGHIATWPTTPTYDVPERTPRAWSAADLRKMFQAITLLKGRRNGVPRWLFWQTLMMLIWDTSERIGAILKLKWEHIDMNTRWVIVPAAIRKGRKKDMTYRLSPETVGMLLHLKKYSPDYVLPRIYNEAYLWKLLADILESAGLPSDRWCKFHRMRRSVATHFEAAGGDAQKLLGHASRRTTEGYIDPTLSERPQACDRLFRPDGP